LPVIVRYNKRDLPGVSSTAELARALGVPSHIKQVEACAKFGQGVFETLKLIVTECMKLVGDPRKAREGRSPSILPGHRASMYPDALSGRFKSDSPRETLEVPKAPPAPEIGAGKNGRD
jgi:hypothetical protein